MAWCAAPRPPGWAGGAAALFWALPWLPGGGAAAAAASPCMTLS